MKSVFLLHLFIMPIHTMNNQALCELSLSSGRRLIAAINAGESAALEEFLISGKMWVEISEYIQASAGPQGHEITEAPGLMPSQFSLSDDEGDSGACGQPNVCICKRDVCQDELDGVFLANYIVEFPVCIGGIEGYTLIFDIFLHRDADPRIGYRLLEVM